MMRTSPRYAFQIGGFGGVTTDEYLHGGPRAREFLRQQGSQFDRWHPPEPNTVEPEAEWGFEPALLEDLHRLADRRGYRLRRIVFQTPDDPSALVAELHRWWYGRRGLPSRRLLVESFFLLQPWWAVRTASVPYWTAFSAEPSAAQLEAYLADAEPYDEIRAMLFSNGVRSIGLADIPRWRGLLKYAKAEGSFLGVDEEEFPEDVASLARHYRELRKVPGRYPRPTSLSLDELDEFLALDGERFNVRWLESPSLASK
jgi:hypothetical protein